MAKRLRDNSITAHDEAPLEDAHTPKFTELDTPEEEPRSKMQCFLPPHKPMIFPSYIEYEAHYNQSHTNRCRECHKNLPTPHFLDLHLSENHDPIMAARRDRGERTFACFVDDCDKVCLEWKKRRSHLVDKHGFPKNYDFFIVNNGIDGRRSMLRPGVDAQGHRKSSRERRSSSATETTQTTDATSMSHSTEQDVVDQPGPSKETAPKGPEISMDQVTKSMSALQFVPRSVTFGKRKGKAGFAKS